MKLVRLVARPAPFALALTLGASGLAAQESPLVAEGHVGAALPVASFASGSRTGEGAEAGLSFGVDFALPGGGRWTPYVGFAQHRFACEGAGCSTDGRYVATGFHGGLRFAVVTGRSLVPWIRVGAVTTRVETADLAGPGAGVSDLAVGAEVGVGVHVGAASQIALNPSVRLAALNTELPGGALLRIRYLVADLALVLSF